VGAGPIIVPARHAEATEEQNPALWWPGTDSIVSSGGGPEGRVLLLKSNLGAKTVDFLCILPSQVAEKNADHALGLGLFTLRTRRFGVRIAAGAPLLELRTRFWSIVNDTAARAS